MQYQVPQFIEIEDKVVGPLTFRQFVYVAGGVGISFLFYVWLPFLIAVPLIVAFASLAGALAFYKFNNKPFAHFIESALRFTVGSKLYIWHKEKKKPEAKEVEQAVPEGMYVPKLSDSKLRDIAWSLDVHEQERRPSALVRGQNFEI